MNDYRRFPRIHHVSPQEIMPLSDAVSPRSHLVVTKNLSASGLCFSTTTPCQPGSCFLIQLNTDLSVDLEPRDQWLRSGDYFLARTVWLKRLENQAGFEVGARFVERTGCTEEDIVAFTKLINLRMLESLVSYGATNEKRPTLNTTTTD